MTIDIFTQVKIIGVEPTDANAMALSLHHGQRVILDQVGGFADGVAVKEVGEETFHLCKELVDGVVLVSRDSICASIKVRCPFACASFHSEFLMLYMLPIANDEFEVISIFFLLTSLMVFNAFFVQMLYK